MKLFGQVLVAALCICAVTAVSIGGRIDTTGDVVPQLGNSATNLVNGLAGAAESYIDTGSTVVGRQSLMDCFDTYDDELQLINDTTVYQIELCLDMYQSDSTLQKCIDTAMHTLDDNTEIAFNRLQDCIHQTSSLSRNVSSSGSSAFSRNKSGTASGTANGTAGGNSASSSASSNSALSSSSSSSSSSSTGVQKTKCRSNNGFSNRSMNKTKR